MIPPRRYYAPVGPLALTQEMHSHGLLGSHALLLAHDVLKHGSEYERFFTSITTRQPTIILDNGAAEGFMLTPVQLFEAAEIVFADVLCLPDVIMNKEETIKGVKEFMRVWRSTADSFDGEFMAIPQGSTIEEIMDCAREICIELESSPDYWGVPRWVANAFGTRAGLVEALHQAYPEVALHLLGMSKNTDDDIACCKLPGVIGIDSANPLVLGQQKINMFHEDLSDKHPDREGYWDEQTLTMESIWNVVKLRSVIQG